MAFFKQLHNEFPQNVCVIVVLWVGKPLIVIMMSAISSSSYYYNVMLEQTSYIHSDLYAYLFQYVDGLTKTHQMSSSHSRENSC